MVQKQSFTLTRCQRAIPAPLLKRNPAQQSGSLPLLSLPCSTVCIHMSSHCQSRFLCLFFLLLVLRDRQRHQARNLLSFKKQVVAVLTAVILLISADQYFTTTTTEIKFLFYILPSSVPQRDTAAQPDHIIKTMPEMANLVYNMYMHMIQTSQKNRQVLKMEHHTLKDFCDATVKSFFFF